MRRIICIKGLFRILDDIPPVKTTSALLIADTAENIMKSNSIVCMTVIMGVEGLYKMYTYRAIPLQLRYTGSNYSLRSVSFFKHRKPTSFWGYTKISNIPVIWLGLLRRHGSLTENSSNCNSFYWYLGLKNIHRIHRDSLSVMICKLCVIIHYDSD